MTNGIDFVAGVKTPYPGFSDIRLQTKFEVVPGAAGHKTLTSKVDLKLNAHHHILDVTGSKTDKLQGKMITTSTYVPLHKIVVSFESGIFAANTKITRNDKDSVKVKLNGVYKTQEYAMKMVIDHTFGA